MIHTIEQENLNKFNDTIDKKPSEKEFIEKKDKSKKFKRGQTTINNKNNQYTEHDNNYSKTVRLKKVKKIKRKNSQSECDLKE